MAGLSNIECLAELNLRIFSFHCFCALFFLSTFLSVKTTTYLSTYCFRISKLAIVLIISFLLLNLFITEQQKWLSSDY